MKRKILFSILIIAVFACWANVVCLLAQPPAVPANTLNNLGINLPYVISQGYSIGADEVISALRAVTCTTIDTGQGANELYPMDQDMLSTSSVLFDDVVVTDELTVDSEAITNWDDLSAYIDLGDEGGSGFSLGAYTYLLTINDTYVGDPGVQLYLVYNQTSDLVFSDTNYTAAIIYAAEAASAKGGGYIYHTEGRYDLNHPAVFLDISNVVFGGTHGAEIRVDSTQLYAFGSYGYQFNVDANTHPCYNITIRDLTWNCTAVNDITDGSVIMIERSCDLFWFENLNMFGGVCFTHIYSQDSPGFVYVLNNYFFKCKSTAGVVHPHSGHQWIIIGNIFKSCIGEAIRHGTVVANNRIYNHDITGRYNAYDFAVVGGDSDYDTGYVFSGNLLDINNGGGFLTWDERTIVDGNIIYATLGGVLIDDRDCIVSNNLVYRTSTNRYPFEVTANGHNALLSDNMAYNPYSEALVITDAYGVTVDTLTVWSPNHLGSGGDDCVLVTRSNHTELLNIKFYHDDAYYVDWGIRLVGCENTTIRGGSFDGCANAVYLVNSNYCSVTDIMCGEGAYNITGGVNNMVYDNRFLGNGTDTGANSQIFDNYDPWSNLWLSKVNGPP